MSQDSTLARGMTRSHNVAPESKFVPAVLPWALAAAALLVYLLTLNHWVSLNSLFAVANVSGWTWQAQLNGPVYWLVTLPFHWLPPRSIPLALNLFSAVCAALSLALLARSVALLPQDRTEQQRARERSPFALLSIRSAWLPPVLAALICGLQLTFWENATVTSNDMLDLLLFAYVIRCILEFRIDGRDSWLLRASLVYGAAMTNNWAMVGFFPVLLAVLIWIKGSSFFNGRFLGRMFLFGTAGLSLYLLLPLVNSFSGSSQLTFWQGLKTNLAAQKQILFIVPFNKYALIHGLTNDSPLWVLALPSLLPLLVLGIRWPSYFGEQSRLGVSITTFVFHVVHGSLLLLCAWVALDPDKFSPRQILPGLPLLTFYYLGALSIGYYSGYLLLVFGAKPAGRLRRPMPTYPPFVNVTVVGATWALLFLAPALMVYRNLPQVRTSNGPLLRQFADQAAQTLPAQGGIVLSDDPVRLFLVRSALTQTGRSADFMLVDTVSLRAPEYHRFLAKKYPRRWQNSPPANVKEIYDGEILDLVVKLAQTNALYYLHPSFGYYFEVFYAEPHGLVSRLVRYPADTLNKPPLSPELISENENFWSRVDDSTFKPLFAAIAPPSSSKAGFVAGLENRLHLHREANQTAVFLGKLYSRSVDAWGVELQRQGGLKEAAIQFSRATELNPANVAALVSLECNRRLQAGEKTIVQLSKSIQDQVGKYRTALQMLNENGPIDEPVFCGREGQAFIQGGNYRQGAQEFSRVATLAPDNLQSRLVLARLCVINRLPAEALKVVNEIHSREDSFGINATNRNDLLLVETASHLIGNDLKRAEAVVDSALQKYPRDAEMLAGVTQLYMNYGLYSNALAMIERELQLRPENPAALVNKGYACLQVNSFDQAIPPLSRVLEMGTNTVPIDLHYSALFDRAIAYLRSDKLAESQRDYEVLQKVLPTAFQFYYGLGEIAYRRKDTNAAIRNYELYLANSPATNSSEVGFVRSRLAELKSGGR